MIKPRFALAADPARNGNCLLKAAVPDGNREVGGLFEEVRHWAGAAARDNLACAEITMFIRCLLAPRP
jgi:hypothetical protein